MRLAVAIAVYLVASISMADSSKGDKLVNVSENNLTTGDTVLNAGDVTGSTYSSKAFGFSHSLGDVDINEGANCMGSEAWGSIIVSRQTNELNQWCAGLFYDLNGKHKMAAIMRCDIKQIAQHFETPADCVAENTIDPGMLPEVPAAAVATLRNLPEILDEQNDREEVRSLELAEYLRRQDALEKSIQRERTARRAYAEAAAIEKKAEAEDEHAFQQRTFDAYQQIAIVKPPEGSH